MHVDMFLARAVVVEISDLNRIALSLRKLTALLDHPLHRLEIWWIIETIPAAKLKVLLRLATCRLVHLVVIVRHFL